MAHLPYEKFDELEDRIKLFETEYLIGFEKSKYEHYHFIVKITDTEYHNFAQEMFIKKYRLRGRAGRKGTPDEGKPRQYGKETTIRSQERAIMYSTKDGEYRTNMDKDYIISLYEKSFKKHDKETDIEKLFKHLDSIKFTDPKYDENWNRQGLLKSDQILTAIYRYINTSDNKLSLSRTAINNYYLRYLRITDNIDIEEKLYLQMKFNNHYQN